AHLRIGPSQYSHFGHSRMHHQHIFDFTGINIVAAANDQFAGTSGNGEITIGTIPAKIARFEPTIRAKYLSSGIRSIPITCKHMWPAYFDFANLSSWEDLAGMAIYNTRLLTWEGTTHGARTAFAFVRVGQVHNGLSHAIAFEDLLTKYTLKINKYL